MGHVPPSSSWLREAESELRRIREVLDDDFKSAWDRTAALFPDVPAPSRRPWFAYLFLAFARYALVALMFVAGVAVWVASGLSAAIFAVVFMSAALLAFRLHATMPSSRRAAERLSMRRGDANRRGELELWLLEHDDVAREYVGGYVAAEKAADEAVLARRALPRLATPPKPLKPTDRSAPAARLRDYSATLARDPAPGLPARCQKKYCVQCDATSPVSLSYVAACCEVRRREFVDELREREVWHDGARDKMTREDALRFVRRRRACS